MHEVLRANASMLPTRMARGRLAVMTGAKLAEYEAAKTMLWTAGCLCLVLMITSLILRGTFVDNTVLGRRL